LYAHEVKDLNKKADAYIAVFADGHLKYTSNVVKDSTEPSWNQVAEFYVEDIPGRSFAIKVQHAKDIENPDPANDQVMGVWIGDGSEMVEMLGCSNKYLKLFVPKNLADSMKSGGSMRSSVMSVEECGKLRISMGYFPVYAESKAHGMSNISNAIKTLAFCNWISSRLRIWKLLMGHLILTAS
jgi:hypothetical protein